MEHCYRAGYLLVFVASLSNFANGLGQKNTNHGVLIVGGTNEKLINGGADTDTDFYGDIEVFPDGCRGPVPDLPVRNPVVASYKGRIISCGGFNITSHELDGDNYYGEISLDCFQLSPDNTWQMIAPLNMARMEFYSMMVEVGDYLVAVFNPYDGLTTIEVYDGENWTMRPDLDPDMENFHETIDLTSGYFINREDWGLSFVMNEFLLTLEIRTGIWKQDEISDPKNDLETMLGAKAQPFGDGILRTGGTSLEISSNLTKFLTLETGSDAWEYYPSMKVPRFGHAMAVIDGIPTVFGGAEAFKPFEVYPAYNTTERFVGGEWVNGEDMKKGRLGHTVIVIPCDDTIE